MRRGTHCAARPERAALLPTFRPGCCFDPVFMRVMLRDLERQGLAIPDRTTCGPYRIYHGDEVSLGRGEILVSEN